MTTWLQTVRLEASKKVILVHVPQGAAKLQAVKVFVFEKIKCSQVALFSYENMIHKKKSTIFEKWKKFDSLQLCSPLRHMDKYYLFGSLQSPTVWIQVVMGVAGLLLLKTLG